MLLHLAQQSSCREAEHSRIPLVVAGREVFLGFFEIWFFNESEHRISRDRSVGRDNRRPHVCLDITVCSLRRVGLDAESHQLALQGQLRRLGDGLSKRPLIGDQMISGQDQHQRIFTVRLGNRERCGGDRRRRISTKRLQNIAIAVITWRPA